MSYSKRSEYLKKVISHIRYVFVRNDIKKELDAHILDKVDYYIKEGKGFAEAEQQAIADMGDPHIVGKQLNREHSPLLGYLFYISRIIVILLLILNIVPLFSIVGSVLSDNIEELEPTTNNILYEKQFDKKVEIDNFTIRFKKIVYDDKNNLYLYFDQYEKGIIKNIYTQLDLGVLKDEKGNLYSDYSISSNGGIITKSLLKIENFPKDKSKLLIDYDKFNREYKAEFLIKDVEENE